MADQEWYTIQELADQFNVSYQRVRNVVAALSSLGAITTRENPQDRRVIQINQNSIESVRKAVFGT